LKAPKHDPSDSRGAAAIKVAPFTANYDIVAGSRTPHKGPDEDGDLLRPELHVLQEPINCQGLPSPGLWNLARAAL